MEVENPVQNCSRPFGDIQFLGAERHEEEGGLGFVVKHSVHRGEVGAGGCDGDRLQAGGEQSVGAYRLQRRGEVQRCEAGSKARSVGRQGECIVSDGGDPFGDIHAVELGTVVTALRRDGGEAASEYHRLHIQHAIVTYSQSWLLLPEQEVVGQFGHIVAYHHRLQAIAVTQPGTCIRKIK